MDNQYQKDLEKLILHKVLDRCNELLKQQKVISVYDYAFDLVCCAKEKAENLGVQVVITVVDTAAQVVMTYRMENALLVSNDMAYKKAYTAIGMRMQSKDLAELTKPDQWLFQLETMTDNKVVSLPGGVPIKVNDQIIGAIGISGGSAIEDQDIATFAIEKVFEG